MPCCANHDRLDRLLKADEYNDHPCGAPTNPHGARRFCCLQCPAQTEPFRVRGAWYDCPDILKHLTPEQIAEVFALARAENLLPRDGGGAA